MKFNIENLISMIHERHMQHATLKFHNPDKHQFRL